MVNRTRTLTPQTVALGLVLTLLSTLQASGLACPLLGCGACTVGVPPSTGAPGSSACCHGHAHHHESAATGHLHGSGVQPTARNADGHPSHTCPCPTTCWCHADPGPSVAPVPVLVNPAPASLSVAAGRQPTPFDIAAASHVVVDRASKRPGPGDLCVLFCRFLA